MIYYLSTDEDHSTNIVIEWSSFFNKTFRRINNSLAEVNELDLTLDNNTGDGSSSSDSIWYRKLCHFKQTKDEELRHHYENENKQFIEFVFNESRFKKIIGTNFTKQHNKLEVLKSAKEYGIKIPGTLLTNSKRALRSFIKEHGKVITKPISEVLTVNIDGKLMRTYTKLADKHFVKKLSTRFSSSLFQQYIEKDLELRVFYLEGKLYPMAIFSQSDNKTKVDFRNYNYEDPNRMVPYKLPYKTEQQLVEFMEAGNFEASSIDMIKGIDGEYYFLEVNPWGQFGMVSGPCNYYLEKIIAEIL